MLAGAALSSPRLPRLRPFVALRSGEPLRALNPSSLSLNPLPVPRVSCSLVNLARSSSGARSKRDAEGLWEDPDDGYGSDYEEMDREEEERGVEGEAKPSYVDNDAIQSTTSEYEEEIVKEVEMLLEPEEKAILQENEVPDLRKISTIKWNPFHNLALSGQIPFMDKLLELGIDIDSVDKDGFTALHKAVIGKKEAVISHLLRKGANPHIRDRDGWTPLHVAIQSRSRDIAKVLLVNGADKTRRNKDGKTPLDLSLCYGRDFKSYELAKLLKLVPANRDP
ncbi:ankyrin repeat domain-containing protein EMB506, chloroplastic isoform X3 [Elaeis guineensis]|uniref:Ankyrin repeat domain-containing protein EMB506, chloroplastic isoform X3 n=1 Tax=Elaeis guineensis var. tenera TaxID=51953 RepID=A0A6J0PLH3_ELAGV|nr:ankyrin repeat domain-containing protein EMB506, chloroplastic isoform X3 [Elaeis guineensis]